MPTNPSYTVEEALSRLQRYCSYQERCHKEVKDKLKSMNMIPEAIDHIVVTLIQDNYLNEERYAQTFVRGKFKIKKWGRNKLRRELTRREISKININNALSEISEEEYLRTFHDLAEKKFSLLKESNRLKRKRKLANYLLYRGWETHLVYDKLRELIP